LSPLAAWAYRPARAAAGDRPPLRRWFHARKPDAGFALCGFPATLLQARIFDEWLDARDESLDAVFAASPVIDGEIAEYYRTFGLLQPQPESAPLL
jgi:adenylate kinase